MFEFFLEILRIIGAFALLVYSFLIVNHDLLLTEEEKEELRKLEAGEETDDDDFV